MERTKELIDKSALIIAIPAKGITKEQVDFFRKELPAGVTASVVKNSLMRIAVKETPFEKLSEHVAEQNMFMFIPEGEAKPAYAAYKKFQKEFKKTDPVHDPRNAIMEGQMYFDKNVEAVSNLPTKLELITKIAIGIKTVPTKVGRGVNAVPNKLGRAFALLRDKLEEEGK